MNLTRNRKLRHLLIEEQIAGTGDVVDPISSGMTLMILGLEPFKRGCFVDDCLQYHETANGPEMLVHSPDSLNQETYQ